MDTKEQKYLNWLAKKMTNQASKQELEALEAWEQQNVSNKKFSEDIVHVWKQTGDYANDIPVDIDGAWNRFEGALEATSTTQKTVVRSLPWIKMVAAAVVVAVLTVGWQAFFQQTTPEIIHLATKGQQQTINLPDGSTVVLNENSTITYEKNFEPRVLELSGEAFFDVTKQAGQSFEIQTATTQTTVLGTSFTIRAYEKEPVEVAVVTGKVAVNKIDESNQKVVLLPKEQVVVRENEPLQKTPQASNAMAWKTQRLVFNNTTLKEVVGTLERYFDIEISSNPAIENCHYTGNFQKPVLQDILDAVAFSTDLEVEQKENKYILTGQGCQ